MLHDQRRDLSLLSFRDFCASKDPNERYQYSNRCDCACAQFAKHIGLTADWDNASIGPCGNNIWQQMNQIAYGGERNDWFLGSTSAPTAHTWGRLRERLDSRLAAG